MDQYGDHISFYNNFTMYHMKTDKSIPKPSAPSKPNKPSNIVTLGESEPSRSVIPSKPPKPSKPSNVVTKTKK